MWKFSLGSIQKKKKNYLIGVTVICLKKNGEWVDNLLWLCAKVLGDLVFLFLMLFGCFLNLSVKLLGSGYGSLVTMIEDCLENLCYYAWGGIWISEAFKVLNDHYITLISPFSEAPISLWKWIFPLLSFMVSLFSKHWYYLLSSSLKAWVIEYFATYMGAWPLVHYKKNY